MTTREKKVYSYMVALSRLYGVVEWRQFIKVFNKYNVPKITKKEILDNPVYGKHRQAYFNIYTNMLISAMIDEDDIDSILNSAEGKEYYIPSEEEITALSKPNSYFEKSEAHLALYQGMRDILKEKVPLNAVEDKLKGIIVILGLMISAEFTHHKIFDMLGKNGIEFKNLEDIQKFNNLLMNAWNNTRMWANRGYTPNEMDSFMFKKYKENEEKTLEKQCSDLNNQFAVQYYKLWYKLIYWINCKYKIVPPFPKPVYGEKVNEQPFIVIREKLWENPKYITEFLNSSVAKDFNDTEKQTLEDWSKKFIKGKFLIHKHLKEYSVFQPFEKELDSKKLYGVYGLTNSIKDMLWDKKMPLLVEAVLLPFKGKIVHDSFIAPYGISFGGGAKESFVQFYKEANDKHGIITSLD